MKNRLLKRHKRAVARGKEKIKISEPDVRTTEEIMAAREASGAPNRASQAMTLNGSALAGRNAPLKGGGTRTDSSD